VQPEDLLKFGLIPEMIGRLPIIATLDELTEEALVNILTVPKNALVKQYKKLLDLDGVELKFTDDALRGIASEAVRRKTGARGLRGILESAMLDVMYDVPSNKLTREVVINADVILHGEAPFVLVEKPGKGGGGKSKSA